MTPRMKALLIDAVRQDGYLDYRDSFADDVEKLREEGYVDIIEPNLATITAEGREALRNAREW